ncbi:uncharacterized protein LOC115878576 isoform X1 [Sitophilus oryzae]|uniref:Uncharacterized protein LOC115878576 isoform X1 n=1 Tax=Sitophilus oryzae TaxID=7048 RepID=A0A6J2XJY0_SITOR|nr:uncharacterized protein LOC115878576 isoform X1 [Sitophilus oryzae]XP_030750969.1 uncharacterized protein LOC115878576 isoform X1 [Sitophilus oryzae]XP_030750970.1 uncharacterized protein LOC115878576 isoform X1 [Sitophilus oryzae]
MLTKVYLCPSDKKYACSWEGSSNDIIEHFIAEHEDLLSLNNIISINLSVLSESFLFFHDTEVYLLQTKLNNGHLQLFLRYLGPPKIASKLKYDVHLDSSDKILDKQNIHVNEGYFDINLDCITNVFGDISFMNCKVLITEEARSTSSDDGVVLEDDKSFNTEPIPDIIINDLKINDKENEVPVETPVNEVNLGSIFRCRKQSTMSTNRVTWYDQTDNVIEHTESREPKVTVQRSSSCATEKTRNSPKRSGSTLISIKESDLDLELRCTNCERHISNPIFVCQSRHNVCKDCYYDKKHCSQCNTEITPDRNVELEKKSDGYRYACRNKKNGCLVRYLFEDIFAHETDCIFCTYNCPLEDCGFKGAYKQMVGHLNLIHSSVKIFESSFAVFSRHNELFLVNERMGIVYCTLKCSDDKVIWTARMPGPKERKFFCELKFKGKNFKFPILLTQYGDYYMKEIPVSYMKEQRLKSKNSILTITR